jgi:hypothetical protein
MMKLTRLIIPLFLLLLIAVVLAWPAYASHRSSGIIQLRMPTAGGGDNPWDPGDENNPNPKPHTKGIHVRIGHRTLLCEEKGDNPWDPGDESPTSTEVRHV